MGAVARYNDCMSHSAVALQVKKCIGKGQNKNSVPRIVLKQPYQDMTEHINVHYKDVVKEYFPRKGGSRAFVTGSDMVLLVQELVKDQLELKCPAEAADVGQPLHWLTQTPALLDSDLGIDMQPWMIKSS